MTEPFHVIVDDDLRMLATVRDTSARATGELLGSGRDIETKNRSGRSAL
jgi:hypothetical protein